MASSYLQATATLAFWEADGRNINDALKEIYRTGQGSIRQKYKHLEIHKTIVDLFGYIYKQLTRRKGREKEGRKEKEQKRKKEEERKKKEVRKEWI